MKIVVVGPGAMGCLFGGFLAKSGQDVTILDKNPDRANRIKKQGIEIEGVSGEHKIEINAISDTKGLADPDLIIISVKSYDTETAINSVKDIIGANTLILTLQNGIGNVETIAEVVGQEKIVAGITSQGATLLGDGHIRHAGKAETVIGHWQATGKKTKKWQIPRHRILEIAKILRQAGFETKLSDNINNLLWSKLIINVGINALTAVTHLKNGMLLEYETTRNLMRQAVLEATKVAKRKRFSLIYSDPIKKVESVAKATAGNISSMLQDILKKKRTEIDYINGAIAREGEDLNIPTPVNAVLTDLVKAIESSYTNQIN